MKAVGIDERDIRKSVLAAFRKAGYNTSADKATTSSLKSEPSSSAHDSAEPEPSAGQILVSISYTADALIVSK